MSEIRAVFEPGTWKDFSKQHAELRCVLEDSLKTCARGKCPDPLAVWGSYGAGKAQFLFWVAEKACYAGLIPVYFHLNDLLDGVAEGASPDDFRKRAGEFVLERIQTCRSASNSGCRSTRTIARRSTPSISTATPIIRFMTSSVMACCLIHFVPNFMILLFILTAAFTRTLLERRQPLVRALNRKTKRLSSTHSTPCSTSVTTQRLSAIGHRTTFSTVRISLLGGKGFLISSRAFRQRSSMSRG